MQVEPMAIVGAVVPQSGLDARGRGTRGQQQHEQEQKAPHGRDFAQDHPVFNAV
jgi:hypothetical protein